ncbi:uracil-DNA glycosylase [Halorarius litoreus]|uniref:uracil-DNA glycosylase n=1 Tax=Halorarius litoreus TaxID=2962676 RepID=UPI0020CBF117|nr:uracil-DNA glycosylase [Halorarius litoreus]
MRDVEFPDSAARNPLAQDCRRCSDLCAARTRISWGVGPLDASLVVVGEAPAEGNPDADDWQGGNLTGMAYTSRASGRKIRTMLSDLGYGGDCYYTNAVKCHPPGNRDPTGEERENCRPYLLEEIEQVAPDAILTTGKHATTSVFAAEGRTLDRFLDAVLTPVDTEIGTVIPLLHPSYQEVWLSRLGYTRESYLEALAETLPRASDR